MKKILLVLLIMIIPNQVISQSETYILKERIDSQLNKMNKAGGNVISSDILSNTLSDITHYAGKRIPYISMKDFRLGKADTASLVYINEAGRSGNFRYIKNDLVSEDDSSMVIKVGRRRYVRQFDGLVNVKWFGAAGDGKTDDTKAIQAAINYLQPIKHDPSYWINKVPETGGGTVFFPDGVYLITNTIRIPSLITVIGTSNSGAYKPTNTTKTGSVILTNFSDPKYAFASNTLNKVSGKLIGVDQGGSWKAFDDGSYQKTFGMHIKNLTFRTLSGTNAYGAIKISLASYCSVSNIEVQPNFAVGIATYFTLNTAIRDCHVNAIKIPIFIGPANAGHEISSVYTNGTSVKSWESLGYPKITNSLSTYFTQYDPTLKDNASIGFFSVGCPTLTLNNIIAEGLDIALMVLDGRASVIGFQWESIFKYGYVARGARIIIYNEAPGQSPTTYKYLMGNWGNVDNYSYNDDESGPRIYKRKDNLSPMKSILADQISKTVNSAMLKTGDAMTGGLGLHGIGANGFHNGTGDGASYTLHNFKFVGSYGMGMIDDKGLTKGYYDFRLGKWDVKDGFYINGVKLQASASPNTAKPVGAVYSQEEIQAILTELRDLKSKLRNAKLLEP